MVYTYAELEVSPAVYDEIASKLRAAGYGDAFVTEHGEHNPTIDMHGLGLVRGAEGMPLDERDVRGLVRMPLPSAHANRGD